MGYAFCFGDVRAAPHNTDGVPADIQTPEFNFDDEAVGPGIAAEESMARAEAVLEALAP